MRLSVKIGALFLKRKTQKYLINKYLLLYL
nr:MAG TPA: hypothetical protein [Caudoviricetes sp.]DAX44866.1 MAG TPA: hypothetical protein [Caudoviricetes sp.]